MQVWSDPRAVQEYKDLLEGKAPKDTVDGPSVIIGKGRIGQTLMDLGKGDDVFVERGGSIPMELDDGVTSFPIYVCVPNDDVEGVIKSCPKDKLDDLVFVQNGMMEPLLKKYALCSVDQTQATLFFTVFKAGSRPQDCLTDLGLDARGEPKYAGETAVCGKWAGALQQRLQRRDLHCAKLFYRDWRRAMVERVVFESAFHLVGSLHNDGKTTLGEVAQYYAEEVEDMISEFNRALRGSMALTLLYGTEERLFALARSRNVEFLPSKVTDFKWRNGLFYGITQTAKSVGFPDPCPMHTEYLEFAKHKGLLDFELEPYQP